MMDKIPVAEPDIGEDELKNVTEAVKSGWVSSKGKYIKEFESEFSKFIGTKHGIAVSSGTAALHLALAALNIGRGDNVILPSLTFVASANAVAYTGAKTVFVDSDKGHWCIDANKIEEKIDKNTKAIMPVHLYGHPCEMDKIMEVAKKHGLYVVEDCAEAPGAEFKGKKVGNFGDISAFSYYGNKVVTTGEGGMCLTNDDTLAEKASILRDQGIDKKLPTYYHEVVGFNYRMTNLQAGFGVAQLKKIYKFIEKKRWIAKRYKELLGGVEGITSAPEMPWAKSVYWMSSILVKKELRDKLRDYLALAGVETRPFFWPMHMLPMFKGNERFPVAEDISSRGINLPSSVKLTEEQLTYVAEKVKEFYKSQ